MMMLEMDREVKALRYSACVVVALSFSLLFTLLDFFVEWSDIRLFNGDPASGQFNARVILFLREVQVIQLVGNTPSNIRRTDIAAYGEAACGTTARTGDMCLGLIAKMDTGAMLDVVLCVILFAVVWGLAYFSWLTHQLRWNLLPREDDIVRVGLYGCLLNEDGLGFSWKGWIRDPCAAIALMAGALVFSVPFGLVGWVVGADITRFRWERGLINSFFGIDAQWFFQGAQGQQVMNAGYNMFGLTIVCLICSIVSGVLARDAYRAIVHGEVDKSMGDFTATATEKMGETLGRWGSWWWNLIPGMLNGLKGPPKKDATEKEAVKVANPAYFSEGAAKKAAPVPAAKLVTLAEESEPSPFDTGFRSGRDAGRPAVAQTFDDDESPFGNTSAYDRRI